MGEPPTADLNELVAALRHEIACLTRRLDDLSADQGRLVAENKQLREQLEHARKEAARSAAPFRRRDAKKIPLDQQKRPGRPAGHPGLNRPIPNSIDDEVDVPLTCCPHCQGAVDHSHSHIQYIEEIPVVRPRVTKLTTHSGTCPKCGPVRSSHPLQAGRGFHASACQLGPRALALAATLNKQHGLSMRKTCRVLWEACGLKLSPGGLSQALDRVADRLEPDYQQLFVDVRAGPAVYVDETSWWVGGPGQWLWTFTSPTTTLFQVRDARSSAVVLDVLTPEFGGVLVSDCLNSYDAGVPFAHKHKCIAHHQKAIREQLDSPGLRDRAYLEAWKGFFRGVCEVWAAWPQMVLEQRASVRLHFAARREELLTREVTQTEDVRIRNRLLKQQPYLLTCLEKPDVVEPTNNRAERALRPAVIGRKVSCGNKTERGKRTWERIVSVVVTLAQRGRNVLSELVTRCSLSQPNPVG